MESVFNFCIQHLFLPKQNDKLFPKCSITIIKIDRFTISGETPLPFTPLASIVPGLVPVTRDSIMPHTFNSPSPRECASRECTSQYAPLEDSYLARYLVIWSHFPYTRENINLHIDFFRVSQCELVTLFSI